ncbi:MAG: DUF1002 domain-containing protein [Blautia sp.]|nr:DUF1002 domain-containing protein [Blautia sp.]
MLALGSLAPSVGVAADALRVVTLGADLSDAQKQTMLKYFKVNADEVKIIYVTNQDERNHLASYVPIEQIGTRTVSCAYVRPTKEGGIKVRTANLNWVTGNMIASSLSTSGVKNCEVIAACPFEVSGTGALTGVQMAYEVASGEKLDPAKKDVATEEIVITGNLAEEVGQQEATYVINKAKMEVIGNNIQNAEEIYNVVNNIVNQNNYYIPQEEITQIVNLLEQMVALQYDYDDMQDTLEMVDNNVSDIAVEDGFDEGDEGDEAEFEDTLDIDAEDSMAAEAVDEDSILNDIDESVLGEEVIISSTDAADQGAEASAVEDDWDWETFVESGSDTPAADEQQISADTGSENTAEEIQDVFVQPETDDAGSDLIDIEEPGWDVEDDTEMTHIPDAQDQAEDTGDAMDTADITEEEEIPDDLAEDLIDVDQLDTSYLDTASQDNFDQAKLFCEGEYEGNTASLQEALSDPSATADVTLDAATGHELTNKVMNEYLSILGNGTLAYTPSADDTYLSTELNMINRKLKEIFAIPGSTPDQEAQNILQSVSSADQQTLYEDTLAFFENLYGEGSSDSDSDSLEIEDIEEDAAEAQADTYLMEEDSLDDVYEHDTDEYIEEEEAY